jgi:hypothetical protein
MNSIPSSDDKAAWEAGNTVKPAKAARTKKPDARIPAGEEAGKASKPFSMSYGGTTTAEYLQYMIDRGAR